MFRVTGDAQNVCSDHGREGTKSAREPDQQSPADWRAATIDALAKRRAKNDDGGDGLPFQTQLLPLEPLLP
jgi:hypothetical protein